MSNIAVGTRRQYAEQSLKWDAAVASEKSDDELLQRIWNLSEDSLHVIAALTAAEAEVARWREGYGPELQELETLQTEVARLAQGVTAQAEEARTLREALIDYMASCPANPDDFVQDVAAQNARAALEETT